MDKKMNKNDFIMRPLITNIGKEIGESIFVLSKIDGFDLPYMMICRVGFFSVPQYPTMIMARAMGLGIFNDESKKNYPFTNPYETQLMVERKGVSLEDFAKSHRRDEGFINGLLEKLALSISKIGTFEDETKRIKDEIKKYS